MNLQEAQDLRTSLSEYIRNFRRRHASVYHQVEGYLAMVNELVARAEADNEPPSVRWMDMEMAFERRIVNGMVSNLGYTNPEDFLNAAGDLVERNLRQIMQRLQSGVKARLVMIADFVK